MTPTEKHREIAKQIVDGVLMHDLDVIAVAAIVAKAEREDGHCRISFATSALCAECNQHRAISRASA